MAEGGVDSEAVERRRLFNFLHHYQLNGYYEKLLNEGVTRISHLKAASSNSLRTIGFKELEIDRLVKKLDQNFGKMSKIKSLGRNKFDKDTDEWLKVEGPKSAADQEENAYVAEPAEVLIESATIRLQSKLGEGAYANVYKGCWLKDGIEIPVAVKLIEINEVGVLIREYQSLVKIKHPNVIRMYGLSIDREPMLVEELAEHGSLIAYLHKAGLRIHIELMHRYCVQISDGMSYLAKHNIVHRDLAARNVLLSKPDCAKIADFGMARILEESVGLISMSVASKRIAYAWASLETLNESRYSTESDIWSFGVTAWEIFSHGNMPWGEISLRDVRRNLLQGNRLGRPKLCPPSVYDIMVECWHPNPAKRPSFVEIRERLKSKPPEKAIACRRVIGNKDLRQVGMNIGEPVYITQREDDGVCFGMTASGDIGVFNIADVTFDTKNAQEIPEGVYEQIGEDLPHTYEELPDPGAAKILYDDVKKTVVQRPTSTLEPDLSDHEKRVSKGYDNVNLRNQPVDPITQVTTTPTSPQKAAVPVPKPRQRSASHEPPAHPVLSPPPSQGARSQTLHPGAGHYETNQAYLTMKPGISVLTEDDQEAGEYDLPPPLTLHSKNTSSATVNDRSSGVDNSAYVTIRRSQIHEEDFIEERRRGQDLPSLPPQSASILPSLPDHLNDEQLALVASVKTQLEDTSRGDCVVALERSNWNPKEAVIILKVDSLMKMQFPYISVEDCRSALRHCQMKVNRAAEWLLEKSTELAEKSA